MGCPVCGVRKFNYRPVETTQKCSVCNHVYTAFLDGGGMAFNDLPDSWRCPVCGEPASVYRPVTFEEEKVETTQKCSVCKHVYDAAQDGDGMAFEDLPDSWQCPVCGKPASVYRPVALDEENNFV